MRDSRKLLLLAVIVIALIVLFMTIQAGGNWDYILPRRAKKLFAIALTGVSVSVATVVFQTLTQNKLLTPSLIGLDSLYLLLQTGIVFIFGSATLTTMDKNTQFILAVVLMVGFAGVLYRLIFRGAGRQIYFLLLVGIICGTFFSSLSSFMQMLLDPNEFAVVQDRMFASFNSVNADILMLASGLAVAVFIVFRKDFKFLDVLALGREHAVNLGVNHARLTKRLLVAVTLLVSISTALVGPITFLGFLVANVAYRLMASYRHLLVIPATILISFAALIGGLIVVERVFVFSTSLSVILNFAGGIYFLYLLLKGSKL